MTPDRNFLCPCGSGRKYKRCCLRRDADASRALHLIGAEPDELLLGRDEAIASGNCDPSAVGEAALRKQIQWQATVHPSLGVTPAAALLR